MNWVLFILPILALLILDLHYVHGKSKELGFRQALRWSLFWIALALLFNAVIFFRMGPQVALDFLTAFVVEKSLSMDNLFVFWAIFSFFGIPLIHQYRVLYWGIFGALIFRAVFIWAGIALIGMFHWIMYVLGVFLIVMSLKIASEKGRSMHPDHNPVIRLLRRFMPVSSGYQGGKFFIIQEGKRYATPLFVALIAVETTDVMFALDSVPAVFAITLDPYIVYTSNVFAILGLRALYFVIARLVLRLRFLQYGIAAVLCFVGVKMLFQDFVHISTPFSLGVITLIMTLAVVISLLITPRSTAGKF